MHRGSIAQFAVNQVVSHRMAKKRQMRWSDEGVHVLALVRVEDLNGDLSAHTFGVMTRPRLSAIDRFWARAYVTSGIAPTVWAALSGCEEKLSTRLGFNELGH